MLKVRFNVTWTKTIMTCKFNVGSSYITSSKSFNSYTLSYIHVPNRIWNQISRNKCFGLWWIIYFIFTSRIFWFVMNYLPYICLSDFWLVMNYLPYICLSDFLTWDELFTWYFPLGFLTWDELFTWYFPLGFFDLRWINYLIFTSRIFDLWWIIYLIFTSRIFWFVMNYLPYICLSDFLTCD